MKPLRIKHQAIVGAITDNCEDLTTNQRAWLIFELLRQQKRKSGSVKPNRDYCTLIDIRNGHIAGSGTCPHCNGWIGRADGYVDNTDRYSEIVV